MGEKPSGWESRVIIKRSSRLDQKGKPASSSQDKDCSRQTEKEPLFEDQVSGDKTWEKKKRMSTIFGENGL